MSLISTAEFVTTAIRPVFYLGLTTLLFGIALVSLSKDSKDRKVLGYVAATGILQILWALGLAGVALSLRGLSLVIGA